MHRKQITLASNNITYMVQCSPRVGILFVGCIDQRGDYS